MEPHQPGGLPRASQDQVLTATATEASGSQQPTLKEVKNKGFKPGILNLSKRIQTTASKLAH